MKSDRIKTVRETECLFREVCSKVLGSLMFSDSFLGAFAKLRERLVYSSLFCFVARASLQISPTRCTILLNIFISFLYVFRASICLSSVEKLLYLCDTGICHSVWVASGLVVGLNPTSRPDATNTE